LWTDAATVGQRRGRVKRTKIKAHEKVQKLRNAVFFECFEASEGRKVGSQASAGISDEKLHAVVARSTVESEKTKNTTFGAFLEVEMLKKCTPLWREAHSEVKTEFCSFQSCEAVSFQFLKKSRRIARFR